MDANVGGFNVDPWVGGGGTDDEDEDGSEAELDEEVEVCSGCKERGEVVNAREQPRGAERRELDAMRDRMLAISDVIVSRRGIAIAETLYILTFLSRVLQFLRKHLTTCPGIAFPRCPAKKLKVHSVRHLCGVHGNFSSPLQHLTQEDSTPTLTINQL